MPKQSVGAIHSGHPNELPAILDKYSRPLYYAFDIFLRPIMRSQ